MTAMLDWYRDSVFGVVMRDVPWLFPAFETLHFIGMALLIGVIGIIDLRVLGFAKGLPLAPVHRLLPWAFVGFFLNVITGLGFIASDPHAYVPVAVFQVKMALIGLAGLNALWFWVALRGQLDSWGAGISCSPLARIISGASLVFWAGVITTGRFIAFFGQGTL